MFTICRIVLFVGLLNSLTKAASIELISRAPAASPIAAQGHSRGAITSPDGSRLLFSSAAPDLTNVPGDALFHVYLLERVTGNIRLVDTTPTGALPGGGSIACGISRDNRFVVFQSGADNLGPADSNQTDDVFLRDLTSGAITLVSHNASGTDSGNRGSTVPQITENGDWVIFESDASDLTSADTNSLADIFAWKRSDGSIRLVTAGLNGKSLAAEPGEFTLSSDSRYVLFTAAGAVLTAENVTSKGEVYLHDLQTGATRRVSAALANLPSFNGAYAGNAVMSRDARFVFFVAVPTGAASPALVRVDLNDDSVVLVSDKFASAPSNNDDPYGPAISDDGRFAAFVSGTNVLHWSAASGLSEIIDPRVIQEMGTFSDLPVLSHDGTRVAFVSNATLIDGVGNGNAQLYLRDMVSGQLRLITRTPTGAPANTENDDIVAAFSPNDSELLFEIAADGLVVGDSNNSVDIFSYKVSDGSITLISSNPAETPSPTAFGSSGIGARSVSADGRFVLFTSLARLTANDTNDTYDVFLRDRTLGTTELISAGPDGFSMGGPSSSTGMTPDATKILFESTIKDLAGPGNTRGDRSVYLRERPSGRLRNISLALQGLATDWRFSGDGRYLFLGTIRGEAFRYDLQTDTWLRTFQGASELWPAPDATKALLLNGFLFDFSTMSRERIISTTAVYHFDGTNIFARAGSAIPTILFTNIVTGESLTFPPRAERPAVSADSRFVAYRIQPTSQTISDVYLFDRRSGETILVSKAFGQATGGNGNSSPPTISADGRFVAFESAASDLVQNDNNRMKDTFLYDRLTDRLSAVARPQGVTATANSMSVNPSISADGKVLAFLSAASDLIDGDLNASADVFAAEIDQTLSPQDSDNDTLDDSWERAMFSSLHYGPTDDPDSDGFTNAAEALAGTDPLQASSRLALQIEKIGESIRIKWPSLSGKKYRVEFKASLATPSWTSTGAEIISDGPEATFPLDPGAEGFYQILLVE